MTLRHALLGLLILFASGWASAAWAQPVTVTVSGTFFGPSTGSYSGTFVYDQDTDTVLSASITATAGLDQYGAPIAAETYDEVGASRPAVLALTSAFPAIGNRGLTLIFDPNLNAPAPNIQEAFEGTCIDATCESLVNSRGSLGGTLSIPATVPTLGEWAMILFALTLAGAAGLRLQSTRRPQPAGVRRRG
jgi:hypothetical protein